MENKLPVLITRIDIDAGAETKAYMVQAKQGDKATRFISVLIVEDGREYEPPEDADLIANFTKADGKFAYNAAKIDEGNRILVELTNQVLAVPGEVTCEVEIRAKDSSQVLTSCAFTIKVGKSNRNESAILSSNEMTAFDEKWKQINADMEEWATVERERAAAEEARAKAETAREEAESERAKAESARSSAESARDDAEKQRQTDTQAAIKETKAAAETANNAAARAEDALKNQEELEQTLEQCQEVKNQATQEAKNAAASAAEAEEKKTQAGQSAEAAAGAAGAAAESAEEAKKWADNAKKVAIAYTITAPSTGWTDGNMTWGGMTYTRQCTVDAVDATATPTSVLMSYEGGDYDAYCQVGLIDTRDGSVVLWATSDPAAECQIRVVEVRTSEDR